MVPARNRWGADAIRNSCPNIVVFYQITTKHLHFYNGGDDRASIFLTRGSSVTIR